MNIANISNQMTEYVTQQIRGSEDKKAFEKILDKAKEGQKEEELKEACKAFEAHYLKQLFKEMRKTVPKNTLLEKSVGRDNYEDMLYDGYAEKMSAGEGVGLSQMLYKQLSKHVNVKK